MFDMEPVRRPRTAAWTGAAVLVVIAAAVALYLLVRGGDTHSVTFEVTSSGEKVSSIVHGSGDAQLGKDVGTAAAVPWSKSHQLSDTSGKLWLRALAPAGGAITCTIWVDGRVVAESTTLSGAVCEIPFDDALD